MALSNGRDRTSYKHQILYLNLPYSVTLPVQPEVVAEVTPWTHRTARATDMWHGKDGTVLVSGQYQPDLVENSSTLRGGLFPLASWRRDPATAEWTRWDIGETGIGGFYQSPSDGPDAIWLISSHDTTLKLNRSTDRGRSWSPVPLPSLSQHGLGNAYWLHSLTEFSGSDIPEDPVAVFTTGITPDYAIWFVRFKVTR